MMFFLLFVAVVHLNGAIGGELRIASADDLIEFKGNVNSGTNYSGTTVLLNSDIDFTGKTFEPIGNDSNYFLGTFDGQGHVISNLVMNSSSLQYVGLFGYSKGLTIKNVVLDSSCSITSSFHHVYKDSYTGGIIGRCNSVDKSCNIENTVTLGKISFIGNVSKWSYLGGISGMVICMEISSIVRNSVNYGYVNWTGSSQFSYIGGIIGHTYGYGTTKLTFVQNCFNNGLILFNNIDTRPVEQTIGGIVGCGTFMDINNCVDQGNTILEAESKTIKGGIAGSAGYSLFSHCYWDKDITESAYGSIYSSTFSDSSSFDSTSFELSESVSVGTYTGTSLLDALNAVADYYYLRDYSHWAFNRNSNAVVFTINERAPFTLKSQIILLPSLASEGLWFDGWYTDASCESLLTSFEITEDKELYGKWGENLNNYTITLDTQREGIFVEPIVKQFGSFAQIPSDGIRTYCLVRWWENDYGDIIPWDFAVPAQNLTLHAVWSCTHISNAVDLIDLSRVAESGESFDETTIFLDSDIVFSDELSQVFKPIGNFLGVFDGKGNVISNLVFNDSIYDSGLFSSSMGSTIKNVVLDSSCSISNSYRKFSSSSVSIGGLIGDCYTTRKSCIIENIISMATISFNVSQDISFCFGGIVGNIYSRTSFPDYDAVIMNSVNYGSITYAGSSHAGIGGIVGKISDSKNNIIINCVNYGSVIYTVTDSSGYIGGIAGSISGSTYSASIQNCLNYGVLINNGMASNRYYIGGIAGYTWSTKVENCLSAKKIISTSENAYVGGIMGFGDFYSGTAITHCIWISDMEYPEPNGTGSPVITDSSAIKMINETAIRELNEYIEKNSTWSMWVVLHLNGGSINYFKEEIQICGLLKSLPAPAKEGHKFLFWCIDKECAEQYDPQVEYSSNLSDLYAQWAPINYTVKFDGNGGTPSKSSMVVPFNSEYGELPTASKVGHTFIGWFTEKDNGEEIKGDSTFDAARNQTFYAHWTINNYVVKFDFTNGTEENVSVLFNGTIEYPKDMLQEGFTFVGWIPSPERMPAENTTIKAQWIVTNPSKYVEIVFFQKGLSKEKAEDIIRSYLPNEEEFTTKKFEVDNNTDELRVIIKFNDEEKASTFIEKINENRKFDGNIKSIKPVTDYKESFSFTILLPLLINLAFW